jgi:hypothetical protein
MDLIIRPEFTYTVTARRSRITQDYESQIESKNEREFQREESSSSLIQLVFHIGEAGGTFG